MPNKILLLSPYDIASHRYWWEGLEQNLPEYHWTILTLEARYFAWRMRGNSLSWAYEQREVLEQHYDLIIACSMCDLSSLRGFIPKLASTPTLVYCHENQFFYPENELQQGKLEQQIIQIYNFECADKIIFNSHFNQSTCLAGIQSLLKKLPDHVPQNLLTNIQKKCAVLEIPLQEHGKTYSDKHSPFTITWNHRWEYDKGLKQLYYLVKKITQSGMNCKINILGQQFRQVPEAMQNIIDLLESSKCKGRLGFIEHRDEYFNVLGESHVVLSTSLHEFQGLAIMEAVKLDCFPILPKRLSYQEFFPENYLYESFLDEPEKESEYAFSLINKCYDEWTKGELNVESSLLDSLPSWKNKKAAYQSTFKSLISG